MHLLHRALGGLLQTFVVDAVRVEGALVSMGCALSAAPANSARASTLATRRVLRDVLQASA
ncbi:hypothetical protein [Xanthomonas bromi]|uniref:hypothetical protein n=1 Tax=Xanthomonas bromi TaxID=56449 RepID=UPI001428C69E|nr:hypothetical protein [Xanthomonas bromi]